MACLHENSRWVEISASSGALWWCRDCGAVGDCEEHQWDDKTDARWTAPRLQESFNEDELTQILDWRQRTAEDIARMGGGGGIKDELAAKARRLLAAGGSKGD